MVGGGTADPAEAGQDRAKAAAGPGDAQRHLLDSADRGALAGSAGAFWSLADGVHYFARWRREGVFDRILAQLQIRLDAEGYIDWDLWCVDGSNVRAARAAAGADKKVSPGTRTSRKTTLWAAAAADSGPSSTWLLTAQRCRWPSK